MKNLNIAVISGGDSPEYEISIQSGKQIATSINSDKYDVYMIHQKGSKWTAVSAGEEVNVDKNDFSFVDNTGNKINFDCVFIAIHGTPGEDGKLQGYFDMLKIPYSSCNALTSALTSNKFFCNRYLQGFNVLTAKSVLLRKGNKYEAEKIVEETGLPCFVKPNNGGSSCATSRVNKLEELVPALDSAFAVSNDVIIEQFIDGTEITCGILKTSKDEYIFPITEIVSKNEFFDYESKYNPDLVQEITPARISDELTAKCKQLCSQIYDLLQCSGVVRMDYIISNDKLYFLEVNTVPGMSANSIIPKQAEAYGLTLTELSTFIIEDAIERFAP